ncbi:hypothetical protein T484DRAFT_1959208 [Baffinella frigidus]|nr:hypothetical protein T484DRAFT_1959208 [Cryptophyta sp. CCMP2293]
MVATMEGFRRTSSGSSDKDVGRDAARIRSWSPPSVKVGRDPWRLQKQKSLFKQCSTPCSPLTWNKCVPSPGGDHREGGGFPNGQNSPFFVPAAAAAAAAAAEAAAQIHYQQQQNQHHLHQQQYQAPQHQPDSCSARRGRILPSLEFKPDQGWGSNLPSLEFYPDEEMSSTQDLAPRIEAWLGGSGGEGGGGGQMGGYDQVFGAW